MLGMAHLADTDDAHGAVAAIGEDLETVQDGRPGGDFGHVDNEVHLARHIAHGDQAAPRAFVEGNRESTGRAQQFFLKTRGDGVGFRKHRGRDTCRGQPVGEPGVPKIRDRRHIDEDFREHHEKHRHQQEFARQAAKSIMPEAIAGRSGRGGGFLRDSRSLRRALMFHVTSFQIPRPRPRISDGTTASLKQTAPAVTRTDAGNRSLCAAKHFWALPNSKKLPHGVRVHPVSDRVQ